METGSELSKTVAIFIVQKILLDETGLTYICHTYERFYAVGTVLSNMVNQLVETQAVRLLKHVVRCYLRLSDNLRYVQVLEEAQFVNKYTLERGRHYAHVSQSLSVIKHLVCFSRFEMSSLIHVLF
jgi:hypothetical protein